MQVSGESMKRIRAFLLNAGIMTITSILMSLIGVWFSLYISDKIGSEAMGLFQLIMSVYAFSITLATSGVNLAATRLVAEEIGKNRPSGIKAALHKCLIYSILFGCGTAVVLYCNADFVGMRLLGDQQTILPIKVMAFSLPFLAMSSALSGYFTGVRRVIKNASVQISEKFIQIFLTIVGLTMFAPNGLEYTCLAMIGAGVISELFSFICSYLLYLYDSKRYQQGESPPCGITKRLLGIALPIALSSYIRSGLLTMKNLLVPVQLRKSGLSSKETFSAFGIIQGVAVPVIMFPSTFLNSFSNLIVPELAECQAATKDITDNVRIHHIINWMFQITLLFSIGVAGILLCFSEQIGSMVSSDSSIGFYLRLFAPLIPVMYLDNAVDNMLKGLNEQVSSMRYNVIDAFVSVILVFFLLPIYGIKGYLFVIFVSEILNAALSLNRLVKKTKLRFKLSNWVVKPIICITISTLGVSLMMQALAFSHYSKWVVVMSAIALSTAVYFAALRISLCFDHEDVNWIRNIFKRN